MNTKDEIDGLPINTMTDGVSHRVADALRRINHALAGKNIPLRDTEAFARQLEALAEKFDALTAEPRPREFGQLEEKSSVGTDYDYGAGYSLSFRPVSGKSNALAPPAQYFRGDQCIVGKVIFGAAYEGAPGIVHGGYTAAIMDEVFGIAMTHSAIDVPCMTGTLKVIYRAPVPINAEVIYKAWLDGEEGRKAFMKCTVVDSAGKLLCEGEAIFLKIDPAFYATMGRRD
ncbi:MAG: PaaI family thioesterase [Pseudomonadales bacterium]|nr:PaaI family thioesterase [Pseudomonadales bacterium]